MTEFYYTGETVIKKDDRITFENQVDSGIDVGAGIVFRKNGVYRVVVNDGRIHITNWEDNHTNPEDAYRR